MAEKGEGWLLVHPMSSELGGRAAFFRDRYIPAAEQSADREGGDNVEQILIKMQHALLASKQERVHNYKVFHLPVALAWADLDLDVPPSCPAAQPLLPHSHQPKQIRADSGTLEIQVNQTQSQLTWDTLYSLTY